MGRGQIATKRPTNLTLDMRLVQQARALTPNLSGTVEDLLRDFVARERAGHAAREAAMAEVIDGFNAFHATHGLLSDEFSML
ncbi:MAG: type II toxin-antitoxin system CcdA family antitoxin [Gluconacetobacter diazotrophicus]|nr:type II toxin-antitoxin system CcdA family antitoxin [Gluconacetobacter diazotrophicus]